MASVHDDLALYVLGALDNPSEFEAHLELCGACRAELAELQGVVDVVDMAMTEAKAPPELRERTLAAVRERGRAPQQIDGSPEVPTVGVIPIERARARRARFAGIAAVAALAVVVAGLGIRSLTNDGFSADRIIALAAPDNGPATGEARIDDTESGQVIELTVSHLPAAPSGSYYECWWVGANDGDDVQNRVSAGTFRGGDGTYRMQSSADAARFTKMGVTLEPDDGNPLRTGTKVLTSGPDTTPAPVTPAPATASPAPSPSASAEASAAPAASASEAPLDSPVIIDDESPAP
jgi:hypothetical protein